MLPVRNRQRRHKNEKKIESSTQKSGLPERRRSEDETPKAPRAWGGVSPMGSTPCNFLSSQKIISKLLSTNDMHAFGVTVLNKYPIPEGFQSVACDDWGRPCTQILFCYWSLWWYIGRLLIYVPRYLEKFFCESRYQRLITVMRDFLTWRLTSELKFQKNIVVKWYEKLNWHNNLGLSCDSCGSTTYCERRYNVQLRLIITFDAICGLRWNLRFELNCHLMFMIFDVGAFIAVAYDSRLGSTCELIYC